MWAMGSSDGPVSGKEVSLNYYMVLNFVRNIMGLCFLCLLDNVSGILSSIELFLLAFSSL